jgi:1-deoxy-D-xylulose-5-phosphate synthase
MSDRQAQLLERISSPEDLRRLSIAELAKLAEEIRQLIVRTTARTGGHVAPNLGTVELTLALHYAYDTPRDRVFWDVGHQCYTHKLVTGRGDRFATLRQFGGIAGFPKRSESEYDTFDTGHAGDSVSAAVGSAVGTRLRGGCGKSVVVIGDGSIVSGIALEALNQSGDLKQDLVVILNDNEMSIARSTGAMAQYLNRMITGQVYNRLRADVWNLLGHMPRDLSDKARLAARKVEEGMKNLVVPSLLFEELGFRYIGPVDGHNLTELIGTFRRTQGQRGPVMIHVVTKKGRGFQPATDNPELFHGIGPFDPQTGIPVAAKGPTFTGAFGARIVELAERDDRVAVITAGMCLGTGLKTFREKFPNRFFDVGICEQHAVTFAAGLALAGMKPVVAVYSTFLARALDMIIQDVCLQRLPVVFAVDRAGLVGDDGPTHHGVFDLTYLGMLPNMAVLAPSDEAELAEMLELALSRGEPAAIRYPRGGSGAAERPRSPVEWGRAEVIGEGGNGAVLALGSMLRPCLEAAAGLGLAVVNCRFAKPLDEELIVRLSGRYPHMATVEENVLAGGFGDSVSRVLQRAGMRTELLRIGLPDRFIEHGPRPTLLELSGLSPDGIAGRLREFFGRTEGAVR